MERFTPGIQRRKTYAPRRNTVEDAPVMASSIVVILADGLVHPHERLVTMWLLRVASGEIEL